MKTPRIVRTLVAWAALSAVALSSGLSSADTITYYHNDLLGSPVVATNQSGDVLWRESYRPYGERLILEPGSSTNKIWFTSRHENERTELIYMGKRFYDPLIGRFLSVDPAAFIESNPHSFNRYAYANNNPYKFVDPDGHEAVVANGRIYINPVDASVPRVNVLNNVGAAGFRNNDWSSHSYNVVMHTSVTNAASIGAGFQNNPTPGIDGPASPLGTINNVGALLPLGVDGNNFVRSYSLPSPDPSRYTDIVVNYTMIGGHIAHEGFVLRFGVIQPNGTVTMRSYGEGNSVLQVSALQPLWGGRVESVWQANHREIVNSIK